MKFILLLISLFSFTVNAEEFTKEEVFKIYSDSVEDLDKNLSISKQLNEGNVAEVLAEADLYIDMLMASFYKIANETPDSPCAEGAAILVSEIKEYREQYPTKSVLANNEDYLALLNAIKPVKQTENTQNKLKSIKQNLVRLRKRSECQEL
jgi:predicted secreted Zn-dependent protease